MSHQAQYTTFVHRSSAMRGRTQNLIVFDGSTTTTAESADDDTLDTLDYSGWPPAPEIVECHNCDERACMRRWRSEGRPLRPECAPAFTDHSWPDRRHMGTRALLLAILAEEPLTVKQLVERTNLGYYRVRNMIYEFVKEGAVYGVRSGRGAQTPKIWHVVKGD